MPNRIKTYQSVGAGFVILLCLGLVGWFYYATTQFPEPEVTSVAPADTKVLNTDFNALTQNRLKYESQMPILSQVIPTGRDNPFTPY